MSPIDYVRGGPDDKLTSLVGILANLPTRQPYQSEDVSNPSLFSDTPAVHMARFLIIDEMPVQMGIKKSGRLDSKYLLFIAELDGDRDSFLDKLFETRRDTVKEIWGNCARFPDECDEQGFRDYINDYEIKTTLPFSPYQDTTQPDVSRMLRNRQRLTDLVVTNQTSSPDKLSEAWRDFLKEVEIPAPDPNGTKETTQ